jgi:cytochrome c oxidase assembly protein subunit 15
MSEPVTNPSLRAPRWAFRLALAAALSAVPLLLFGGSVTTIGAGLAVDGWLVPEGHFLVFFPIEKWFRDPGTFVEHTHRLFGVLVGLFAVGAMVLAWAGRRGEAPEAPEAPHAIGRWLASAACVAVALQGTLGGLRVLERDPQLAFLHGALAQAVFACLCASAFALSATWREVRQARAADRPADAGSSRTALAALLATYGAIVAGAWYRHAIRPAPLASSDARFALHLVCVAAAVFALGRLMVRLQNVSEPFLARARKRLASLLALQVLLGLAAWTSQRSDPSAAIGAAEWGLSIAHVLCGGLVLAQTAGIWMVLGGRRAAASEPASTWIPGRAPPVGAPERGAQQA